MSAPFSIQIQGLDNLMWRIKSLPLEAKSQVVKDVTEYALDVLREEKPPQKSVTRVAAYGVSFFTDKQRRFFFAALNDGRIGVPYTRTGTLGDSWTAEQNSDGAVFKNSAPHAPYVMGFAAQSRHEAMVGWKRITDIIAGQLSFRSSKYRAAVMGAVQKAIRKLKLG